MKKKIAKQSPVTYVLSIMVAFIAVVIALFAFIPNAVKNQAESQDVLSIYDDADYDYIIKNPSDAQIEEFKASSSTDKVVPFYQVVYTFSVKNVDREVTIKSLDNEKDLQYTEFSTKRLLNAKETSGKSIYLDYSFVKECGLKIGDEIGSGAMVFIVAGYYKSYDKSIAYAPNLKNVIKSDLSYAGVYVKVADNNLFSSEIINGYKPLATLKGRESFSDDAAYESYLNGFNSKDYSGYIENKNDKRAASEETYTLKSKDAKTSYLIAGVLAGAIIFVGIVAIALFNSKNTKYEVVDGGRKKVISRYTVAGILGTIMSVIVWCVGVIIIMGQQSHYITLLQVLSLGWTSILLPVCANILAVVVNILIVRGYKERKK